MVKELEAPARSLKVQLDVAAGGDPREIERAFEVFESKRDDGAILLTGPWSTQERMLIAGLVAKYRLPAIAELTQLAERTLGLMGYTASVRMDSLLKQLLGVCERSVDSEFS